MNRKKLRELLNAKPSYERDKLLRDYQNSFIEKSNINPRLFDTIFKRCTKKKQTGVEKRQEEKEKTNGM